MSCAVLFYLRRLLPLLLISGSGGALPAFAEGPSQSELDVGGKAADSWLMTNKSYDGRRYVDLRQIEPGNVTRLKEVCTSTAASRLQPSPRRCYMKGASISRSGQRRSPSTQPLAARLGGMNGR